MALGVYFSDVGWAGIEVFFVVANQPQSEDFAKVAGICLGTLNALESVSEIYMRTQAVLTQQGLCLKQ